MTEEEWLACEDPEPMLDLLVPQVSDRKLRLFAVACYFRLWRVRHPTGDLHPMILVAERFADGLASRDELENAEARIGGVGAYSSAASASNAAGAVLGEDASTAARWSARHAADYFGHLEVEAAGYKRENHFATGVIAERKVQAALAREVFGPILFRPIAAAPSWLAWNNETVLRLAQPIYADRAFDRLPILADALEDAGCTSQDILAHCRGGGDHARGCWVVDLILGKT